MKVSPPTEYEDPWYAASNDNSPRNENQVTGSFGNSSSYVGGSMGSYGNDAYDSMTGYDDYDNEPPLLEELGVNFDHVFRYEIGICVLLVCIPYNILLHHYTAKPKQL